MYPIRLWSTRQARLWETAYACVEWAIRMLGPLWGRIGHARLERPMARIEALAKGIFFDCRMCGQCALNATGMTCPMNCPKSIRNGPCGGVRPGGFCEVRAEMRCVWVEAWEGSRRMRQGTAIERVLAPVDHGRTGRSAWLALIRESACAPRSQDGAP